MDEETREILINKLPEDLRSAFINATDEELSEAVSVAAEADELRAEVDKLKAEAGRLRAEAGGLRAEAKKHHDRADEHHDRADEHAADASRHLAKAHEARIEVVHHLANVVILLDKQLDELEHNTHKSHSLTGSAQASSKSSCVML
jgi:uncharacterized coiled-coil DUF342 family protein